MLITQFKQRLATAIQDYLQSAVQGENDYLCQGADVLAATNPTLHTVRVVANIAPPNGQPRAFIIEVREERG